MKKIIFLAAILFAMVVNADAQQRIHFGSKQNNESIEAWKYVADNHKNDNHDWAKAIYQEFGLNDEGAIRHAFVINATDTFNVNNVMALTKMWLMRAFTTEGDTIVEYDVNKRIIRAKVALVGMGDAYGFGGFAASNSEAHVTIPVDITFQFKENRLRYETKISSFILNSSDWVRDIVDKSMPVKECFPVNSKGKHRDSFSRAFINGNAKCLTSCRDFIVYLNNHFGDTRQPTQKKKDEDDW